MKTYRMLPRALALFISTLALAAGVALASPQKEGAIRVLFLGHESEHHNSNKYYPMLAKGLGQDAIYFDYVTSVEEALGDADYLSKFDAVLLYANHGKITPGQWKNLKDYVEGGGGFVPVHCASWCFGNEPEFDQMVGGRFAGHKTGTFTAKVVDAKHPAMAGVKAFAAWDETYKHRNHNEKDRTVLMVREVAEKDDNISEPEPWTWVRTQGKGRVFYTASGHDERVWEQPAFHQLLKAGILWSVGDKRKRSYETFIVGRAPRNDEKRDNIPNYEKRPEPLPYQFPLSAKDSMDYTQVPVGWELELFAAEPQLVNPIFMAWDERGRLWVAETVDYPNDVRDGAGNDTIKILEDTTGDGRCDKVTVFAEGLNIPTSLTFANGGIVVAQAPEFLFLKDTDGDDKADIKETIMTGWGIFDTHAGPSNLRYGIDNWIYGAVGYAGFDGTVGGEDLKFRMGIFRFRPDGSKMEFLHQFNNNTWGLGMNSAGDIFGSTANGNPAFFAGIPQTAYPKTMIAMSAKMIADKVEIHPITPNIRQVDGFGKYTAGAGYALATSDNFPPAWRDRMAFIGGPTGNLLGMFDNIRDGSGYAAKNRYNLIVSADEWFSPVAAEVGPDGHLWVADWYNFIIQHNPTPSVELGGYEGIRGKAGAHENPNRDKHHGRIYRVKWEGATQSSISSLDKASDEELVAALGHDNQFWRLAAQRLLVDNQRTDSVPALKKLVDEANGAEAAHALWTLEGLGQLDRDTHQLALLRAGEPILKRNAIRAIANTDEGMQLFFDTAVVQAKDPLVRLAAFSKLAHFPNRDRVEQVARELVGQPDNSEDEWLELALRACGAGNVKRGPGKITGPNLLPNPSFEEIDDNGLPKGWAIRTQGVIDKIVATEGARAGKNSFGISSTLWAESSLYVRVKVKPNTDYRLTGWIKAEAIYGGLGARINAHEVQAQPRGSNTKAFKRAKEWSKVEVTFSSMEHTALTINCLFGGEGRAIGTAWWDDVALHEVEYEITNVEPELTEGDAARGKEIFLTHPIASCIRCHVVNGAGGPIGPALDTIATRKNEDYILQSLVDPGAAIAEGYVGKVSPMPPMGVLLKPQELADVLAYMMTLK